MKVSLVRLTTDSAYFRDAEHLIEEAFPAVERRPREEQRLFTDNNELFCANAVVVDGTFAGIANYWILDDVVYVEHLATVRQMRGRGIASDAITILKRITGRLILEVEPPADDVCRRRIAFYEHNGLRLIDCPYMQPAYSTELQPVELRLMTFGEDINVEIAVRNIRREVYGVGKYV